MGDFILKLIAALSKPHATVAGIVTLLIVVVLSIAPSMPEIVKELSHNRSTTCPDTVTITESVAWYNTPQNLAGIRSFLLRYYHPNEHQLTRQEVESLLGVTLHSHVDQVSVTLNGLNLCFPRVGDWYRVNFDYNQYSEDILNIIFLEQDYDNAQDREILINRLIDLIEATMRSYQNQMSIALRGRIEEVQQ